MASDTHTPPDAHAPPPPDLGESVRRGHEQQDASIRAIVTFMVVLVIGAVVIQFLTWGVMKFLEERNDRANATPSPFAATKQDPHPKAPPEPRLQPSVTHHAEPMEDMNDLRAAWHKTLTTYGPVDGAPGRAHIPLDRAMQLTIERGLGASRAATQPGGPK